MTHAIMAAPMTQVSAMAQGSPSVSGPAANTSVAQNATVIIPTGIAYMYITVNCYNTAARTPQWRRAHRTPMPPSVDQHGRHSTDATHHSSNTEP